MGFNKIGDPKDSFDPPIPLSYVAEVCGVAFEKDWEETLATERLNQQFLDLRLTADRFKFKWLRERPDWVPRTSEGVSILGNNNDQILQVRLSEKLVGEYH